MSVTPVTSIINATRKVQHNQSAKETDRQQQKRVLSNGEPAILPHLAHELIQQILFSLPPRDFERARNTCRRWMLASLDRKLLLTMLSRGGWLGCHISSLDLGISIEEIVKQSHGTSVHELSSSISRELRFSTGYRYMGRSVSSKRLATAELPVKLDFREVRPWKGSLTPNSQAAPIFATSRCGSYVCVGKQCLIYIYHCNKDRFRLVSNIRCPSRIIVIALDVSPSRFALAAVLDGGLGFFTILDVKRFKHHDDFAANSSSHISAARETLDDSNQQDMSVSEDCETYANKCRVPTIDTIEFSSYEKQETILGASTPHGRDVGWINMEWNWHSRDHSTNSSHKKEGHTFFSQLCLPPGKIQAVAICPQRRCVAFAFDNMVSFHWSDPVTEEDFTRNFKPSTPPNFLHFLPSRPEQDPSSMVRLVASSACPLTDTDPTQRRFGEKVYANSAGPVAMRRGKNPEDGSNQMDYYHVVPLSDGVHFLFTDSATGSLCVGVSTVSQQHRSFKLHRKVYLLAPMSLIRRYEADWNLSIPCLYTSSCTSLGNVRVVASYRREVVLYSIPSDLMQFSRHESLGENAPPTAGSSGDIGKSHPDYVPEYVSYWPANASARLNDLLVTKDDPEVRSSWPLATEGLLIGSVSSEIVHLSISEVTNTILRVQVFTSDGLATTWQLD